MKVKDKAFNGVEADTTLMDIAALGMEIYPIVPATLKRVKLR